jgi:hypothetical protein
MHLFGRRAGALALICALTACGSPATPEPVVAPPVPEPAILPEPPPPPPRVLTVLVVPEPLRLPVVDEAHPAKYFGSVGRLLASADANAKTAEFTAATHHLGLHLGADITVTLEQALQRDGWVLHQVDVPRDRPDALLADPAAYAGPGEAVLDVAIGSAGYMAAGISDPYGPCVTAQARLSTATEPAVTLYTEQISYGACAFPGYAALPAVPGYRYDSYDQLAIQAGTAADGLRHGAAAIAQRVAPQVVRALP